jgi:hypothetical protein
MRVVCAAVAQAAPSGVCADGAVEIVNAAKGDARNPAPQASSNASAKKRTQRVARETSDAAEPRGSVRAVSLAQLSPADAIASRREGLEDDAIDMVFGADDEASESAVPAAVSGEDRASEGPSKGTEDLGPDELARLLARYAAEPSAAQVAAAALRVQQLDPSRYAELASRARLRGLLPHLDLGIRRGRGIDLRSTATGDLGSGTTADDLTLFATLRFDLGQLLMASAELPIAREERAARAAQSQLVRQVVRLYFIRRRLLLERDWRGRSDVSRELRIAESEALLDAFTDGAFRRMITDSHGQPPQAPALSGGGRR